MRYYNPISNKIERVRPRKMPNPTGRQRERLKLRSLCRSIDQRGLADAGYLSVGGQLVSAKRQARRDALPRTATWVGRLTIQRLEREWKQRLQRAMLGRP